jgi:23S rRNA (uridine2552-2'-O)-methyltransferase
MISPTRNAAGRVRVRTAKGRKPSSNRWLERQLNDPYVHEAKAKGFRSRAAFKLLELDDRFHFLKPGTRVLDLGAAPGGWSQVAAKKVGPSGLVIAADILDIAPLPGVTALNLDIADPEAPAKLWDVLAGSVDVVLSDMAASTTGHRATDHLRTVVLMEAALHIAEAMLKPGGVFVGKVFQGGATAELLARIKKMFRDVKHVKPRASRAESVELYLVALGYRGRKEGQI